MIKAHKYNFLSAMSAGLVAFAIYLPLLGGGVMDAGADIPATGIISPIYTMSLNFDRSLWGGGAWGHHLSNAVLHALNTMAVFALAALLLRKASHWPALFAALVFALHPANTEAVSWVQARSDLLYTLPLLLAFASYLYWSEHDRPAGLVLCFSFFFLSLICSEKAVAFAVVLPLFALLRGPAGAGKRKRLAAAAALCAAGIAAFYLLKSVSPDSAPFFAWKASSRDVGLGVGYYVLRLFVPLGLTVFPPLPQGAAHYLLALAGAAATAMLYHWRLREEAFYLAWALIALVPSFFAISPSGSMLGEHHMYLSSAALAVLAASALWRAERPRAVLAAAGAVTLILATLTVGRIADWKDESRLMSAALRKTGESFEHPAQASTALTMLGAAELRSGDLRKARLHLLEAISANRDNYMAYFNIGRLYDRLLRQMKRDGDVPGQKELAREAAAVLGQGATYFPNYIYLQFNLGVWQVRNLDWDDAEKSFRATLRLGPDEGTEAAIQDYLELIAEARRRGIWGYNPAEGLLLEGARNKGSLDDIIRP